MNVQSVLIPQHQKYHNQLPTCAKVQAQWLIRMTTA